MRFLGAVLLAVCFATSSFAADKFVVGNWQGSAVFQKDGNFSHCSMVVQYEHGDMLAFSIDANGTLGIGLSNPDWRFGRESTPFSVKIDRFEPWYSRALTDNQNLLFAQFEKGDRLFHALQRGYSLTVSTVEGKSIYDLKGTNAALSRLYDCAYASMRGVSVAELYRSREDTVSNAATPERKFESAIDPSELTILASNILSSSGVTGFRILSKDERAEIMPSFQVAWIGQGDTFGGLIGYNIKASSANDEFLTPVASQIIGDDAKNCSGQFLSGSIPKLSDDAGYIRRIYTACEGLSETVRVEYSLYALKSGQYYLLASGSYLQKGVEEGQTRPESQSVDSERLFQSASLQLFK